jgi:hypothetical protein
LKLKLFSGDNVSEDFIVDLKKVLDLELDKQQLLLHGLVRISREALKTRTQDIAAELGVNKEDFMTYVSVIRAIVPRVLAGKGTPDAVDELISLGLERPKLENLLSAIANLPEDEKQELRHWTLVGLIDRNHWHGISSDVMFKSAMDSDFVLGAIPLSNIRIVIQPEGSEDEAKEETCRMEMTSRELDELIYTLESAKKELQSATKEIKARLDKNLVSV